jgi:glyoxylase-like metal-dependent hydrolase (beta-lactamase superfamily II)
MVIIEGRENLIVVDTFESPIDTNIAKRIIRDRYEKPVAYLFNTHYRRDRSNGNQVFYDSIIVAHDRAMGPMNLAEKSRPGRISTLKNELEALKSKSEETANEEDLNQLNRQISSLGRRIQALSLVKFTPPKRTLLGGTILEFEGLTIHVKHYRMANTDADLALFVEEDGVIITGGIASNGATPLWDEISGANISDRIAALDELLTTQAKYSTIIPGSGYAGEFDIISLQRDYLVKLLASVKMYKAEGVDLETALTSVDLSGFESWAQFEQNRAAGIEAVWNWLEDEE